MRNLTAVLICASLVGCSVESNKRGTNVTPVPKADVISNEFVFSGDKELVSQYLDSMSIKASFNQVSPGIESYHVRYQGGVPYQTIADGLQNQVDYIEPNFKVRADASADRYAWPTDRLFFKQWALNNIGQSAPFGLPGTEAADMDIVKAWGITKGSKDVLVAVLDTGIDYSHPDLKSNMWVNDKESEAGGGTPGKDDDGNGYTDDVYGFDFYSMGRSAPWYGKIGDPDPMDESGHGTHCAGSIGATPNNGDGIAGLNWNVKIMALRFLGDGGGSSVDAARAIYYVVEHNKRNPNAPVDIMSNSWGGGGDSKLIRKAIADVKKAGVLFVAAAGNEGTNNDVKPAYPASYQKDDKDQERLTNILSVGASDNQDNPADFSNFGSDTVHVFAPGVQIVSTYPVSMSPTRPYVVMSGTSMAAPYVAGVAALMIANNKALRGRPEEIRNIIIQTADVSDSLVGKSTSNGRINAFRALSTKNNMGLATKWQTKSKVINQRGFNQELVDIRHEIKVDGATAVRVHFDFIQIQEPYDSVYIYDKNYRLVTHVETTETRDSWSAIVPGDTVYVRYTNALVKQVMMSMAPPQSSEAACVTLGAIEITKKGDQFVCSVDNEDSSGESNKPYNTFNSEGFSIDQVAYLEGAPTTTTVAGVKK